jgi:methylmalonyl-CoA/ethylmalonyl-CoA epimerase
LILLQVAQRAYNLKRAEAFYTDLLGIDPAGRFDPPGLLFYDLEGVRLLIEKGAPSSLLYLKLPDVRIGLERLRGQGVEVIAEPQVIFSHENSRLGPAGTDEWMAFIKDSEGNTLGLVSQLPPG